MRSSLNVLLGLAISVAPVAPLAAAGPASDPADEARFAKFIAGRTAGKPVACIPATVGNSESTTLPGIGMAFRQGSTWYVSRFEGGCPQLRSDVYVVTQVRGSSRCRGDIVDLRSPPAFPRGSCIFGSFTPYTKQ